MNHLAIKNLCIALEALSRINNYHAMDAATEIHKLLEKEIKAGKEPAPELRVPGGLDDDIPF